VGEEEWGWQGATEYGGRGLSARLGALGSLQALLHVASLVRDLAGVGLMAIPVGGTQCQVAAGHVLAVALLLGIAGLDAAGERLAISRPGHLHGAGVEVFQQTHQRGFALRGDLLGGRREEEEFRGGLGPACEGGRESDMGSGIPCAPPYPPPCLPCLPLLSLPQTPHFLHSEEFKIYNSNAFRFGTHFHIFNIYICIKKVCVCVFVIHTHMWTYRLYCT